MMTSIIGRFTAGGHLIVWCCSVGQSWDGMHIRCCSNFIQIGLSISTSNLPREAISWKWQREEIRGGDQ